MNNATTGNRVGYARVSTTDQDATLQLDALQDAGCVRVFTDHASGATTKRPALHDLLEYLQPGNVLVVWRLDRLGRSLSDLVSIIEDLHQRNVHLLSLTEAIDTTSAMGQLVFHLAGAFAEFERNIIRERTRAGLAAAAARGRVGGRPTVMNEKKLAAARVMLAAGQSKRDTAAALGVSRSSLSRALNRVLAPPVTDA